MSRRARIITRHTRDCEALRQCRIGNWASPWYLDGTTVWRDAIGKRSRGGATRWLVARCNSRHCAAEALVDGEEIARVEVGDLKVFKSAMQAARRALSEGQDDD